MSAFLFYLAIPFLLFGFAYPVAAILIYPLYKLCGGKLTLGEILRDL